MFPVPFPVPFPLVFIIFLRKLQTSINQSKILSEHSTTKFALQYATVIVNGKLSYDIELWSSTTKVNIN